MLQQHLPFTVLKLLNTGYHCHQKLLKLQQHLPFTVLKPIEIDDTNQRRMALQQHLPFTVLKLPGSNETCEFFTNVATAPTVYGIETIS